LQHVKAILAATLAAFSLALYCGSASAHPHVWVTTQATVLYENGTVTGLQQNWAFDEYYTQTAIEGLDKDGDGKYSREELKELAQVNIDGLKEFDYFTFARLGDTALKFKPPVDYWLDYTDKGVLTLHFTLPLEQPVPAETPGFNFSVFDSSYFIAFDFAPQDPIKLSAHAPPGCKPAIHEPNEDDDADLKKLNDAFSSALGSDAQKPGASGPMGTAGSVNLGGAGKTVAIQCAKS
jgi:ABC-type uncharacterized transport system substrate-binding protein